MPKELYLFIKNIMFITNETDFFCLSVYTHRKTDKLQVQECFYLKMKILLDILCKYRKLIWINQNFPEI